MPQRRAPVEPKATQEQWAESKLNESLSRFVNSVLNAHKTGKLGKIVGPGGYGKGTMGLDYLGELYYNLRKKGMTGSIDDPEELNLLQSIDELKQGKVFEQARSTFGEGLVERFEKFLPSAMHKPYAVLNSAIRYKIRNEFIRNLIDNPGMRKAYNDLSKRDAYQMQAPPKNPYYTQLIQRIMNDPSYDEYENKLVNKYLAPGSQIDPTDFNPFITHPKTIAKFLQDQYGDPEFDPYEAWGNDIINSSVIPDELIEGADKSPVKRKEVWVKRSKDNYNKYFRKKVQ